MSGEVTVDEDWYDGPVYVVNVAPTDDGRIGSSFHIYGDVEARRVLAALRQAVEKRSTFSPSEGFVTLSASSGPNRSDSVE